MILGPTFLKNHFRNSIGQLARLTHKRTDGLLYVNMAQKSIQWVAAAFIHDVCAFNSDF